MRSLRFQLLLGTALGTTAVLLASGVALHALLSRTLWAEFDAALAAKARALAAMVEQDDAKLEFELTEVSLPEFESSERAEYYQIWLADNTVFARSPSLHGQDLERISGTLEDPTLKSVTLPDGRPGRIVGVTFAPRQDQENTAVPPATNATLVLGRDIIDLQATLARTRSLLIGVCLGAVVLSAGILAWVIRRSLRPVHDLSRQIAAVAADDLSTRIKAVGIPAELSTVVERLNDLLARVDDAFQRERRFTGDVAHELRTPLAGLRSKLELGLSRERDPESYRAAMGGCLEIGLQMQRMVENLLHLARADAGQLEVQHETIDVQKLVAECWQPLADKAEARGLRVAWKLNALHPAETDRDKLRLIIQNILDNAVTYVDDRGRISVESSGENGALALTVSNTGGSLPPENVQRVFDRFWRGDPSCDSAGAEHCGLGLPLCKALIERLEGSIEATATRDGLFTVAIRLPAIGPHGRAPPDGGSRG